MKRIYIYCEGQTEESFVNELLYTPFLTKGILLVPIICTTKRETSGLKYKGGVSVYGKIRAELVKLCRSHQREYVTMLFDYYGLPPDTPGMETLPKGPPLDRILYLEKNIGKDIGAENFIPNLVMHEFEGLLFSSPEAFSYCVQSESSILELKKIRDAHSSPEDIDNDPITAPSKRILKIYPPYRKVLHGISIARDIGIHTIANECKHFGNWLMRISAI